MKNLLDAVTPPKKWKVPVIIAFGVLTGLALFLLHIGKADSYLSDNPETCINCHVMYPQFAAWNHSSHRNVATCNDCHVPQNNFISKFLFKASDGLRHSFMFTFRLEPQVIKIKDAGRNVVNENCKRCHGKFMSHITAIKYMNTESDKEENEKVCWECHQETPHGTVSSLSAFPHAITQQSGDVVPEWMKKHIKTELK